MNKQSGFGLIGIILVITIIAIFAVLQYSENSTFLKNEPTSPILEPIEQAEDIANTLNEHSNTINRQMIDVSF